MDQVLGMMLYPHTPARLRFPSAVGVLFGYETSGFRLTKKDNVESWPAIGKEIGSVIRDQMKSGEAPVTEVAIDTGNNELFNQVNELIKNDINPSIASHGGVITLQSVSDGKAYVTMGGGCKGCSASSVTLKQGVESYIVAKVDGVTELVDITNHVEGENPWNDSPR